MYGCFLGQDTIEAGITAFGPQEPPINPVDVPLEQGQYPLPALVSSVFENVPPVSGITNTNPFPWVLLAFTLFIVFAPRSSQRRY